MNSWHTVKVKYTKEFQDGTLKRVTEPYLVSAISFTDAEARIYQEVGEFIRGEFMVTSIAKTDFNDIFQYDDAEVWYKAKVSYVSEDADSGKEKKVNTNYLVSAGNVKEAYERIEESLKGLMVTFEIPTISVTPIVEIFPYVAMEDEGEDPAATAAVTEEEEEPTSSVNVAYAIGNEEE
ncbi:hypothetical protein DNU06_08180 [Putridiphycobacter roseus]|uniref:DUF4494 domain-containing protein n=1 Tax=Putridiphycobacter roseus TaxID=2219161 RepID=A0A2W1N2N1_9FLAO|nr:DUF4494 domain-containing protein [Putridiphycobacter roseus]PZE17241.1 hypothetical protein DNU06_08180 [Putridiphycobacter roseus]